MLRWTIRIVVCLVILLLGLGLAVYVFFQTDLPRQLATKQLSERLGMEATVDSIVLSLGGKATLRGVRLKMPLDGEDFITADELQLSHTAVPLVPLVGFQVSLVCATGLELAVQENAQGRWNVQDIAARLGGLRSEAPRSGTIALPAVSIQEATVRIIDANGLVTVVGPVSLVGEPKSRLMWGFHLYAPSGIDLSGRLTTGYDWGHVVDMQLNVPSALTASVGAGSGLPVELAGRWEGRLGDSGLAGRVVLDDLAIGDLEARGHCGVELRSGALVLRPEDVVVSEPNLAGQTVHLARGLVSVDGRGLQAESLVVRTAAFDASLSGRWDWNARVGELSGTWAGTQPSRMVTHSGAVTASFKSPRFGLREARVVFSGRVQDASGAGQVSATVEGRGGQWMRSQWQVSIPELSWSGEDERLDLGGASAAVRVAWPQVALAELQWPSAAQVRANGQWNAETRRWAVDLDAHGIRPEGYAREGLDVRLSGEGDDREAVVSLLRLGRGDRVISAEGRLSIASRELYEAHLSVDWPVPSSAGESNSGGVSAWRCEFDVNGSAWPVQIQADGAISGHSIAFGRGTVSDVNVPVRVQLGSDRIGISTEAFDLLGGQCRIEGQYDPERQSASLQLTAQELLVSSVGAVAGFPLACQGRAGAELQLFVPELDIHQAVAFGSWDAEGLSVGPFETQNGRGNVRVADGVVEFGDIEFQQQQGQASGSMRFRLDRPQLLSMVFQTAQWPLQWDRPEVTVSVDSNAALDVDVVDKTIHGRGNLTGRVQVAAEYLGRFSSQAVLGGRTLDVCDFEAELLGGKVTGVAHIPLDRWTDSRGRFQWRDVNLAALDPWWPLASPVMGLVEGSIVATSAEGRTRAHEPIRLELTSAVNDGWIGPAPLEEVRVVAHLGSQRVLVENATFRLFGGQITSRGRLSPHVGKYHVSLFGDFRDIDLDHLVHVFEPEADNIPGRLAGEMALTVPSDMSSLAGHAELRLSESDLAGSRIVRTLYDALSAKIGTRQPTGNGQITLLFEGRGMSIPGFVYFNRGVEIRGAGHIGDLSLGASSPMEGYAVGSTRILRGIQLPGARELDRLMASLQRGVASVRISGTLGQRDVQVVPLPDVGEAFRRLLWTQLRED